MVGRKRNKWMNGGKERVVEERRGERVGEREREYKREEKGGKEKEGNR